MMIQLYAAVRAQSNQVEYGAMFGVLYALIKLIAISSTTVSKADHSGHSHSDQRGVPYLITLIVIASTVARVGMYVLHTAISHPA